MNVVRLLILPCLGLALAAPAEAAWTWTNLDYPGATNTYVSGISGTTIVGYYTMPDSGTNGFIFNGNSWVSLTHPGGNGTTAPTGISEDRIAGYYHSNSFQDAGFVYDGFTWTTLAVTGFTRARGIYKNEIVGYYEYENPIHGPTYSGFIYDGDTFKDIRYPDAHSTKAYGIWQDTIVGVYTPEWRFGAPSYGFIYDGQTWKTVAKEGAATTRVLGIEGNRMVGSWHVDPTSIIGFLLEGDIWTDFICPWGTQTEPHGISGDRIVGVYRGADGNDHGFLLTIPEPTAAALLAIGGLALARRRRWRPHRMGKGGQP